MQCRLVTNLFFIIFELSATPPTSPIRSRTTPSENDAGGIQHEVRHLVAGRPGAGQGPPSSRLFNMQKTFSVLYQELIMRKSIICFHHFGFQWYQSTFYQVQCSKLLWQEFHILFGDQQYCSSLVTCRSTGNGWPCTYCRTAAFHSIPRYAWHCLGVLAYGSLRGKSLVGCPR